MADVFVNTNSSFDGVACGISLTSSHGEGKVFHKDSQLLTNACTSIHSVKNSLDTLTRKRDCSAPLMNS